MSTTPSLPLRSNAVGLAIIVGLVASACAGTTSTPATSVAPSAPPSAAPPASASAPSSQVPSSAPVSSSPSPAAAGEPAFDAANFPDGATVTNPWFPLIPGTVFKSRGIKDGKAAIDIVTVTDRTKVIAGVTTRVVDDRTTLDGIPSERTTDYYAQDASGNVWYIGEDTAELDTKGNIVNRDGTWHAGVDGAVPGIFMEADPVIGHAFRQEFYPGQAEDHYQVISLTATVHVPYGAFSDALRTKEWTPLEPDVLDAKFYVRGIGLVRETAVKGPKETFSLVSVKKP